MGSHQQQFRLFGLAVGANGFGQGYAWNRIRFDPNHPAVVGDPYLRLRQRHRILYKCLGDTPELVAGSHYNYILKHHGKRKGHDHSRAFPPSRLDMDDSVDLLHCLARGGKAITFAREIGHHLDGGESFVEQNRHKIRPDVRKPLTRRQVGHGVPIDARAIVGDRHLDTVLYQPRTNLDRAGCRLACLDSLL